MQNLERFETLENHVLTALDEAEAAGMDSALGQNAFSRAMTALDQLDEVRGSQIYSPLAADPLTRDYVSHLDGQLQGLVTRIDILRTHIEMSLLATTSDAGLLNASLVRLNRQLQVRFHREAALVPVYVGWVERSAVAAERIAAASH